MTDHPLVCICIPTYNAASTVRETLASILGQTYPNLVVHVSDNASTDDTIKVVESMGDPRVVIHRNETNIGGEGNFNRCIQMAEGKYTAIFHADDLYDPEMVAQQVAFLEAQPEVGAVFTEAALIDDSGKIFGEARLPKELSANDHLYDFITLFKVVLHRWNFFICPSAMVRTDIYRDEIRKYRGDIFKSSADLDVWLRISQKHLVAIFPIALMRYRISKFQFSAGIRNQTDRMDFFLVTDYYLAQQDVQKLLTDLDMMHYRWIERTDRVRRAVNLFMLGRIKESTCLCDGVFSIDAVRAAIDGRRGFLTLVAGCFVRVFSFLGMYSLGRKLLNLGRR